MDRRNAAQGLQSLPKLLKLNQRLYHWAKPYLLCIGYISVCVHIMVQGIPNSMEIEMALNIV